VPAPARNRYRPRVFRFFDAVVAGMVDAGLRQGRRRGPEHESLSSRRSASFGLVVGGHRDETIADVTDGAQPDENQLYVETMFNLGKKRRLARRDAVGWAL